MKQTYVLANRKFMNVCMHRQYWTLVMMVSARVLSVLICSLKLGVGLILFLNFGFCPCML